MRKFLMAAALLAVVACGDKKDKAADSAAMVAPAPTMSMSDSQHKADSMKADSVHKADSARVADSIAKIKKP